MGKLLARENFPMFKEMSTKANGKMTKPTVTASTFTIKQEQSMKDTGKTICNMGLESRIIRMEINMKECSNKVKGMDKESITWQMELYIRDSG